jgi:hypothetical protein
MIMFSVVSSVRLLEGLDDDDMRPAELDEDPAEEEDEEEPAQDAVGESVQSKEATSTVSVYE